MIGTALALLLAAGISAATGVASGVVSSINTAKTNQANIDATLAANSAAAAEAQKNRDFQEYMSNTAHQREVADLRKAGLNPWLSVSGSGAPVTNGSTAQQDAPRLNNPGDFGLGNLSSSLQSLAFLAALSSRGSTSKQINKLLK